MRRVNRESVSLRQYCIIFQDAVIVAFLARDTYCVLLVVHSTQPLSLVYSGLIIGIDYA